MCIWDFVIDPHDIESFAVASQRISSLSARYVREHNYLRQQYSAISFNNLSWGSKPAEFLGEILLNPRIALYVREVEIMGWDGDGPGGAMSLASSKIAKADLERAILASQLVPSSEVGEWIKDAIQGYEDPVVAIIMMQLKRIRKFQLIDEGQNDYLLKALKLITQNPDWNSLDALPETSIFSNLREMGIISPSIDSNMICKMLPSSTALTSFIYDNAGTESYGDYNTLDICEELLECSRHSLQKLVLYQDDLTYMGYITSFTSLAELETCFDNLLVGPDGDYSHLSDMVPKSIKNVALLLSMDTDPETLRKVILEVIDSKTDRLPNLKTLTIGVEDPYDFEPDQYLVIQDLQGAFVGTGAVLEWSDALRSHF